MSRPAPQPRRERIAHTGVAAGIALLACVLLFWRIGAYPLTDGDAGFYGRVARNILDTGEWGVLRFDPVHPTSDVDKPPLGIWATAIAFRLLGPTDVAARLWHSLAALALVGVTAALAFRVAGRRAALVAATVLLTSGLFFYQAREPMLDVPLTLCLTAMLWLMVGAGRPRVWLRYYGACLLVGLGVMIKGPVAAALAAGPIVLTILCARRHDPAALPRVAFRVLLGIGLIVIVVLPWHLWVLSKAGIAFFDMYAGTLSWRRYLSPQFPPGVAILPYAFFALAGLVPWAGLAIPALWMGCREGRSQPPLGLLAVYILCAIGFFGLSPGRIVGRYLLPVIPAFAVLIAVWFEQPRARAVGGAALATIISGALLAPMGAYLGRIDAGHLGSVVRVLLFLLAATMVGGGVVLLRQRLRAGIAVLAGGAATAYLVLLVAALPVVVALYPERALAERINQAQGTRARVAVYRPESIEPLLSFYLDARLERLATEADLARFLSWPEGAWILERPEIPLPSEPRLTLDVVADHGRAVLLRTKR